jgi:hypothetical protein
MQDSSFTSSLTSSQQHRDALDNSVHSSNELLNNHESQRSYTAFPLLKVDPKAEEEEKARDGLGIDGGFMNNNIQV